MNKKWKTKKQEYLINNKWIKVRQDSVITSKGVEIPDFYVLEYPDCINVLAITREGKFIVERQYRHGIKETHYELCAGIVEKGEDPLEAAKRELLEETGYGGGKWELYMKSAFNPAMLSSINYTYIARDVEHISTQQLEKTEDIDVHLLTKEELLEKMNNGDIIQGIMLAPLWKYMNETE